MQIFHVHQATSGDIQLQQHTWQILAKSIVECKHQRILLGGDDDDDPFIVLTETKFSFRCIPVWIGTLLTGLGSKKNTCDNVLTMTSTVPW
jgi:hypothetical protein